MADIEISVATTLSRVVGLISALQNDQREIRQALELQALNADALEDPERQQQILVVRALLQSVEGSVLELEELLPDLELIGRSSVAQEDD